MGNNNLGCDFMTCTFFGHRYISGNIEERLRYIIMEQINFRGVDTFYVGTHGEFDRLVRKVLKEITKDYVDIRYYVVLSGVPTRGIEYENSIVPDGIEDVPPRAGIVYRNEWMIKRSDIVISYIDHTAASEAARFTELAKKLNKTVVSIV